MNAFDVVVVGAGPAGSVAAFYLAEAGLSVLVLERHPFPRYHIGESLTGTAGDFVRELGLAGEVERLDFPFKTGVKVMGQGGRSEFFVPVLRPTWQVRRAEFDQLLLERAIAAGAVHRYASVKQVLQHRGKVTGVAYKAEGARTDVLTRVRAKVVVDASGHSALLSKHRIAGPRRVDAFSRQIAVFTQYEGAIRDPGEMGNNTFIFYSRTHHWAWFIPLSKTVVSVGIVAPVSTMKEDGRDPEQMMGWGIENINPDLARRVEGRPTVEPVRTISNYSYRIEPFAGDGWICVGDAHRFADPIFSFGVSFAMAEAKAAAHAVVRAIREGSSAAPFAEYVAYSNRGQDAAFDLIRYFWRFPAFFAYLTRGAQRRDVIRLLAGDCFDPEPVGALVTMRTSLGEMPLDEFADERAVEVARRVHGRYSDFQGVEAAYIDSGPDGICIYFLLADDDVDLYDHLSDFEEKLYDEFGRDDLAVVSFTPMVADHAQPELRARRVVRRPQSALGAARPIFDRRPRSS